MLGARFEIISVNRSIRILLDIIWICYKFIIDTSGRISTVVFLLSIYRSFIIQNINCPTRVWLYNRWHLISVTVDSVHWLHGECEPLFSSPHCLRHTTFLLRVLRTKHNHASARTHAHARSLARSHAHTHTSKNILYGVWKTIAKIFAAC